MTDQERTRWTKLVADYEASDLTQREFATDTASSPGGYPTRNAALANGWRVIRSPWTAGSYRLRSLSLARRRQVTLADGPHGLGGERSRGGEQVLQRSSLKRGGVLQHRRVALGRRGEARIHFGIDQDGLAP